MDDRTRRSDRQRPHPGGIGGRTFRAAVAASLLAGAGAAPAADAPSRHVGLQLEAGLPAGATLTAVVRPWPLLRLDAGIGYDVLAFGVVGGATLVPWQGSVRLTFGVNAGHYFSADVNRLVSTDSAALKTFLSDVSSTFVSGDIGVEMGPPDGAVFFVRVGLAYLFPSASNLEAALRQASPGIDYTVGPYSMSARTPTIRIGVVVMAF